MLPFAGTGQHDADFADNREMKYQEEEHRRQLDKMQLAAAEGGRGRGAVGAVVRTHLAYLMVQEPDERRSQMLKVLQQEHEGLKEKYTRLQHDFERLQVLEKV